MGDQRREYGCLAFVLGGLTGCDALLGLNEVRRDDAGTADVAVAVDVAGDADPFLRSCQALFQAHPSSPSGSYMIDPDGPGGDAPVNVTCDMTTSGGGWTIVFLAPSTNLTAAPIPYSVTSPSLLAAAQDALMVYRHADNTVYPSAASFVLPSDWRTNPPFFYQATDLPIMVSIDGAAPVAKTLRYGQQNFSTQCSDPWVADQPYGRVCIEATTAPLYSGFVTTNGDWCANTGSAFNSAACSADRRFSIAVR